jgi:mRNA-degrading endonuclease toxin of MazEF toxin-antitoxin module
LVLTPDESGLDVPSDVNVSQHATVDKSDFIEKVGRISPSYVEAILAGIDVVLGR